MSQALRSAPRDGATDEDTTLPPCPQICEVTGERLFRAGEYAAPGEYIEAETQRRLLLAAPDFLPARLDGHAACYRCIRPGWGSREEAALMRRQAQFQQLVTQTHSRLYNFARRSLGNCQDAEDVTQETLARAWKHFAAYDARRSFDAWVFRIAGNLIIDQSRRKHRQEVSLEARAPIPDGIGGEQEGFCSLELPDRSGSPEDCLMAKEVSAALQAALRSLPPVHRTTLLLVARQRSYEQIAHDLDCPVGTVRSRVYRARIRLKRHLKESTLHD